ncbi:MAG: indolepyruvate ferredoxin oxidoreductase [Deltaproteobacteria bacterium]|nr:indolepyruvate ferredoxin oxidoreductase [Deltaproteobacteria bacterium]
MDKIRIFLTGVGGQGTLTATTLLANIALDNDIPVTAGEIHGMAQRGGVVESFVLMGGWKSPRIDLGEADILLGFEPLETLRALPYLKKNGLIVSNSEPMLPPGVAAGRESYPDLDLIKSKASAWASKTLFLPCRSLGIEAGSPLAANTVLMAALFGSGALPFGLDALERGIGMYMKPKIVDLNIRAMRLADRALAN